MQEFEDKSNNNKKASNEEVFIWQAQGKEIQREEHSSSDRVKEHCLTNQILTWHLKYMVWQMGPCKERRLIGLIEYPKLIIKHVKMSKRSGISLVSVSLSVSQAEKHPPMLVLTLRNRPVKGKETPNSITKQDVKGQTHIKVLQRAEVLLKGWRRELCLMYLWQFFQLKWLFVFGLRRQEWH